MPEEIVAGHAENPAPLVAAAFARIAATRMADLPINNPALSVDTVGFRPWNGHWLGVLVTPWTINLLLLPGTAPGFRRLGLDERQNWDFPAGTFAFMGNEEEGIGPYQFCSLFSPTHDFADQRAACLTALAALDALFNPDLVAGADAGPAAAVSARPAVAAGSGHGGGIESAAGRTAEPPAPAKVSRRDFLRGRFGRGAG